MKINCPDCKSNYDIDATYIGKDVECVNCKQNFKVFNTNLTECPDCFALISKRAQACPSCGAILMANPNQTFVNTAFSSNADAEGEEEVMLCHQSVMNYFWFVVFGILTIPLIVGIFILLSVWTMTRFTSYRITTKRIVVNRGWIAKAQTEIWIKDMRGASLSQGVWQRMIGLGNVSIGTAATAGTEICMTGIANPQAVVDKINALRH